MELKIGSRIRRAYNAFMNRDPTRSYQDYGAGYSRRPDRVRLSYGNERSIITSVYNRIAVDAAAMAMYHCRTDDDGQFVDYVKSGLNSCLTLEANIDQSGRAFRQDIVMTMLDEGCVAIVPVDTDDDPAVKQTGSYDILTMRTGRVITWYPSNVRVNVYDEHDGIRKDVIVPKKATALVENPFYAVMNESNSTAKRLAHKLSLLDATDDYNASGNVDLIIQLPYTVKGENRRKLAEERRKELQDQLAGSTYGVAYIDGTERITQLNRSLENHLMKQVEYFTNLLFSQLNITQSILDGTADEKTMLNYYERTIEPILAAISDEMKRKFLTRTAITQGQTIMFFRDPFKLVPVSDIAEIADKFTRNEVMTANEMRQKIGLKPSTDPKADELINSNIRQPEEPANTETTVSEKEETIQNE